MGKRGFEVFQQPPAAAAGKECTPGKKAATGGLRAVGMECLQRVKAAIDGDRTVGKECPHAKEKAAIGRQRGAGKECASEEGNGGKAADLEGLYFVWGKGKIVGPEYLLGKPIDLGKPEQWVQACEQRAQVLGKEMPSCDF
jgi:hypothetical protein